MIDNYFENTPSITEAKRKFLEDLYLAINYLREKPKKYVEKNIKDNKNTTDDKLIYYLPLLNYRKWTNRLLLTHNLCKIADDELNKSRKMFVNSQEEKDKDSYIQDNYGKNYSLYHKTQDYKNPIDFLNDILLDKEKLNQLLSYEYRYIGICIDYINDAVEATIDLYEKNMIENDYILNDKEPDMTALKNGLEIDNNHNLYSGYTQEYLNEHPYDFRGKNPYNNSEAYNYFKTVKNGLDEHGKIAFITRNGVKVPYGAKYVLQRDAYNKNQEKKPKNQFTTTKRTVYEDGRIIREFV